MFRTNVHRPYSFNKGFTLVELMVATTISIFVFIGIITAYITIGRNLARLANSQQLEVTTRTVFYFLNQDASSAISTQIAADVSPILTPPSPINSHTQLTLTLPLPTAPLPLPPPTAAILKVTYTFLQTNGTLQRTTQYFTSAGVAVSSGSTSVTLHSHLSACDFEYFNNSGSPINPTSVGIKSIELTVTNSLGGVSDGSLFSNAFGTSYGTLSQTAVVSSRILLRNLPLLQ
jgi:hypothetical protein